MTIDLLAAADLRWPPLPYLGLRRFEADDARLYSGRGADLRRCRTLLFSNTVRVLVLQGLSGSGKSSFLRAGLLPCIHTQGRSERAGVVPMGPPVTAGPGMLCEIARQVHAFVIDGPGRAVWEGQADELQADYPDREAFATSVGDDIEVLLDFMGKLNRSPSYEFLIAVDQVEDLWSVPELFEKEKLHDDFFALVNEFAEERLNGKLVLTLRTERYGVFASRLPAATTPAFNYGGVNRLCHHYLANPSREELIAFVKRPLEPGNPYGFRLEEGLAETIVDDMRRLVDNERSEVCVLPLLQVLLGRLYVESRDRARDRPFEITEAIYRELPIGSRSSVGILDAHLHWGIARAVAQAFANTSGPTRSIVNQRIEEARWRTVLKKLAGTAAGGGRVSLRKSRAELDRLAVEAACEVPLDHMLELLKLPEISLVTVAADGHSLTLQHDLLGMTFDAVGTPTPRTWAERVRERRRRIDHAIGYTIDQLFGDAPPQRHSLTIAELRFWDHKLLSYADALHLFDRLGFDVLRVKCDENVTAEELAGRLANGTSAEAVYSFPRELMSDHERRASTELVVLNLFTGFAIVCNRAVNFSSAGDDWTWERFDECLQSMFTSREPPPHYLAEDSLAKDFFLKVLDIARLRLGPSSHETIDQLASSVTIVDDPGTAIMDWIIRRREPCIAILTAPTWAVARMVESDVSTLMDHQGLLDLLHQPSDLPPDEVRRLRRGLLIHNAMHIQWPRSRQWAEGEDEPVLLRLASVGLFLADCLWADDEAAGRWIRERWNNTPSLAGDDITSVSSDVFLSTFRRAYRYAPSSEYSETYFESDWPDECPTALHVYRRLMELRLDFHQLCADTTAKIRGGGECAPDGIAALIERAHRNAAISNYFDAWRLMKIASDCLAGGNEK